MIRGTTQGAWALALAVTIATPAVTPVRTNSVSQTAMLFFAETMCSDIESILCGLAIRQCPRILANCQLPIANC